MDTIVLDKREEKGAVCFLTKIFLKDYIENLSEDYRTYEIQREIVANSYLDNLVYTVLNKYHIPPIVLILEEFKEENQTLKIKSFKILDGLQRTYRLNAIWKTLKLFREELNGNNNMLLMTKYQLSKEYSKRLLSFDSSTRILQIIIDFYNKHKNLPGFEIEDSFGKNFQWFEIWSGLSAEDEVSKMLVLNAGHKPVKIKHQLELIFRNLIPLLKKTGLENFEIVREKDVSSIQFSKNRQVRHFHFSHIIAALLSLKEGKPVTTNSSYIQKLQDADFDTEKDSQYFTFSFLKLFITSLVEIDDLISKEFGDVGIKWFGREVTLVGIYAALGSQVNNGERKLEEAIASISPIISQSVSNINIREFEEERKKLDLGKINIGNVNKNAIYNAFIEILKSSTFNSISWSKYFNTSVA